MIIARGLLPCGCGGSRPHRAQYSTPRCTTWNRMTTAGSAPSTLCPLFGQQALEPHAVYEEALGLAFLHGELAVLRRSFPPAYPTAGASPRCSVPTGDSCSRRARGARRPPRVKALQRRRTGARRYARHAGEVRRAFETPSAGAPAWKFSRRDDEAPDGACGPCAASALSQRPATSPAPSLTASRVTGATPRRKVDLPIRCSATGHEHFSGVASVYPHARAATTHS